MRKKFLTLRQVYWLEQWEVIRLGFFPFLIQLFVSFAIGAAFGLGLFLGIYIPSVIQ